MPSPQLPGQLLPLTKHSEPANLVHEQSGHNVPRKHSQRPQEADKIHHVGAFTRPRHVQGAALLVVQECAIHQTAVHKLVLKQVWGRRQDRQTVTAHVRGRLLVMLRAVPLRGLAGRALRISQDTMAKYQITSPKELGSFYVTK